MSNAAAEDSLGLRPLKFRIWDRLTKTMIYPEHGYQGHYTLSLNGQFHNLQNGSGGKETIVSQFTGEVDAAGQDVYEGDLVKSPDQTVSVVQFSRGHYLPDLSTPGLKIVGHIFT